MDCPKWFTGKEYQNSRIRDFINSIFSLGEIYKIPNDYFYNTEKWMNILDESRQACVNDNALISALKKAYPGYEVDIFTIDNGQDVLTVFGWDVAEKKETLRMLNDNYPWACFKIASLDSFDTKSVLTSLSHDEINEIGLIGNLRMSLDETIEVINKEWFIPEKKGAKKLLLRILEHRGDWDFIFKIEEKDWRQNVSVKNVVELLLSDLGLINKLEDKDAINSFLAQISTYYLWPIKEIRLSENLWEESKIFTALNDEEVKTIRGYSRLSSNHDTILKTINSNSFRRNLKEKFWNRIDLAMDLLLNFLNYKFANNTKDNKLTSFGIDSDWNVIEFSDEVFWIADIKSRDVSDLVWSFIPKQGWKLTISG